MSSCTLAGAELGLIDKWVLKSDKTIIMEIKDNDKITISNDGGSSVKEYGKIVRGNSSTKQLVIKFKKYDGDYEYYEYGVVCYDFTLDLQTLYWDGIPYSRK